MARGLGPPHLTEIGLTAALDAMVDRVVSVSSIVFKRRLEQVDDVFNAEEAISVYRIAQEAINNVLKHSQAKQAAVELIRDLCEVRLTVADDGCGIKPATGNGTWHGGLGLSEMRVRSRILGGKFNVEAGPNGGTRLTLTIPIRQCVRRSPGPSAITDRDTEDTEQ
jgi:signal transduction histidine kinase